MVMIMIGNWQTEISKVVSSPEIKTVSSGLILGDCLRFLEEIGSFTIKSHRLEKHRYHRNSELEKRLLSECVHLIKQNTKVRVSAGINLKKMDLENKFTRLLPVIKQSFELSLQSMGESFSLRTVHVGILESKKNGWDPKVCISLIGYRPHLIDANRLTVYLGYYPETNSITSYRKALCRIYSGRIDFMEKYALEKQTVQRLIQHQVFGVYNN